MTSGVVVAYCRPQQVEGLFCESLIQLMLHDSGANKRVTRLGGVISLGTGPRIHAARNQLVEQFIKHPLRPEWLWMVDADMTFAPDIVDRLVETAETNRLLILGGMCFGGGRAGACFPTLYRLEDPTLNDDGKVVRIIEDYPPDDLVRVDATGAACLLIHRTAIARIYDTFANITSPSGKKYVNPSPWFAESQYAGREFGEDWTFCMRASQVGIPIHVHTGIRLGHVKATILDEEEFRRFQAKRDELGGQDAVSVDYRERVFGR